MKFKMKMDKTSALSFDKLNQKIWKRIFIIIGDETLLEYLILSSWKYECVAIPHQK
jgi:hypothetical protein